MAVVEQDIQAVHQAQEAPRRRVVTVTTVRRNYAHPDLLQTGVITREELVGDELISKKRIGTIDFGNRRDRSPKTQG